MKDDSRVSTEGLIKIGELAKQTDTNITTLKYYIREGLIRPVMKTGKNMSWYDPSCIETVNLIRMLQKERYYPLSVIRDLLETDKLKRPPEMALLDAIHKVDDKTDPTIFSKEDAARMSGLTKDQIDMLSQAGLITAAKKKRSEVFTEEDIAIMSIVRVRMDAGIPIEQSVEALRIYDRALRNAAQADIDSFVDLIMQQDFSAQTGAHMIRVSDQTLDEFVTLRRKEYNRSYGKSYVEKLYRFLVQCAGVLSKLEKVYRKYGFHEAASICADAAAGVFPESTEVAACVRMFTGSEAGQKSDLITKITACRQSREFFTSGNGSNGNFDPEMRVLLDSLRCLWLKMAPEALQCEDQAEEAEALLLETLNEVCPGKGRLIYSEILSTAR